MKAIVVTNWKMHPATMREAKRLFEATKKAADAAKGASVVVAPPAIFLRELSALYRGKKIAFAVQHAHPESVGAHTGEISLAQVKDARAQYAIIGHAECRARGETNDEVRRKVVSALSLKLTPILCIGEKVRTQSGEHFEFVREQIRTALLEIAPAHIAKMLIAYEPVWAIGTSHAMPPREMHEMSIFIRKMVVEFAGDAGHKVRILYGGSVDEKNAGAMLREGDIRGFLVGRASVNAQEFSVLLQAIEAV